MSNIEGRGEIPSFKNIVAGESSRDGMQGGLKKNNRDTPVLGNRWQARLNGRCLPRALKNPGL